MVMMALLYLWIVRFFIVVQVPWVKRGVEHWECSLIWALLNMQMNEVVFDEVYIPVRLLLKNESNNRLFQT